MSGPNWCKHYRGMNDSETCEAGVRFDALANHGTKPFYDSCPCFGKRGGCEKAEYPTAEEIEEEEKELSERFDNIVKARSEINADCGGPWKRGDKGQSGEIDCPACGVAKVLRYTRSGYNGHIHATCSTEGCVAWME